METIVSKKHCYIAKLSLTEINTVIGWLVMCPRPDQNQMYPDQDTIAQLLPAGRFVCLFLLYDCSRESLNI